MYKITITGVVQGVGFRPFIYRKAHEAKAKGTVKNTGNGVEIISDIDFINNITRWPPLAKIENISREKTKEQKFQDFNIIKSGSTEGTTNLPPDIFICDECVNEMNDPKNRRHGYYFTTCTNCGPRFSMIEDYPYDRPNTSMDDFGMCDECRKEYTDPLDRRYHAQTIACPNCGPKLKLMYHSINLGKETDEETIKEAVKLLLKGTILSIKGVGGFHLSCIATKKYLERLRFMIRRPFKPFALMVRDIEMARKIAHISKEEEKLLNSPERPIVVLKKKRKDFSLVSELDSLGIMLPYTALHYLLFNHLDVPLVMTSANYPGEPISINEDVGEYFLTHERRIINRCDDSVIKFIDDKPQFLRRSRGFVPLPIKMEHYVDDCIAVGAELNNTICIGTKNRAYLSQHIGSTGKLKTFDNFKSIIDTFIRLTRIKPKKIICDLHPEFMTTRYARELSRRYNAQLVQVQHHKAHVAGCASEHNLRDYVGIACDGVGYGEDGNSWGGEVFLVRDNKFSRIGHLEYLPMIGGDSAAREPKKMLFGILTKTLSKNMMLRTKLFKKYEAEFFLKLLHENYNIAYTSSAGRVLDSVAGMLGICDYSNYEGRPAMLLESIAGKPLKVRPEIEIKDGVKILKTSGIISLLYKKFRSGVKKETIAATIHDYLWRGLLEIAQSEKLPIVFSGGVGYNRIIAGSLAKKGVLLHKQVPCGDGGISFGQVAYLREQKS